LICNEIRDCPSGEDEMERICQPQICPPKTFRCSHGRCIDEKSLCDNFNDCLNGDDESDLLCKRMACGYGPDCDTLDDGATLFCPSIISNRLLVSCKYANRKVSCERNIRPGTIAEYVCRDFYQPKSLFYKYNNRAVCQPNGQWSSDILKCEPKCGYIKDTIPLIVNGFTIEPAAVPWHATIFIRSSRKDSKVVVDEYEFACGATLISELVVLSAAHCFAYVNETSVKIAIGKRYSNFTISSDDDEPIAQYFDVIRIFRHPLYLDRLGNYGSDIALVELNQTVMMSDDIHPACIDWKWNDLTWHLANNSMGVVAGMGVTENEVTSEYLRVIKIPVVDDEHCIMSHSEDFRKYITFTTFCAGWANGTSVCNGDSGGGLVFPSKSDANKWIIQGIVSLSPRRQSTFQCDPKKYTIFTKVSLYRNWIRSVLDKIHEDAYKMLLDNNTDEYYPIL
jgi:modular serine protease